MFKTFVSLLSGHSSYMQFNLGRKQYRYYSTTTTTTTPTTTTAAAAKR